MRQKDLLALYLSAYARVMVTLLSKLSEKELPVLKKMGYSFQEETVLAALSQWHPC
jgi:hypothetical protein